MIPPGHDINEATSDRVGETKGKNHYNFKSEYETRRNKVVDQGFGRQNYSMSQSTLDSNTLRTNTTNRTTLPSYSIPVGTKSPKTTSTELPTDLPGEPDPDPSLSYSPKNLIRQMTQV